MFASVSQLCLVKFTFLTYLAGVQLDLTHTEDVFISTNILGPH
jgi:hypothetical protein